jgi:hypothetical protein
MWPDVEVELVAYLASALGVRVLTELPAPLEAVLPVVQVVRVGGTDDGYRLDRALVDVEAYAAIRGDASDLARRARDALVVGLRGVMTSAAVFGHISTVAAPAWRPYENVNLRRCGATYELYFHPVV